ncbi:hypothetical protein [Phaffia rhodozyma]|uniref:Transcription factor domain, fungi n=1 Tax=Phaffia rhodozyma TaxID=264483 RepID=A0A0F7SNS0_PHARH|nr:hypothetical protein [Phaffia rhodozyma]
MPSLELSGISGNAIGAPFSIQYTNLPFDFKGSSLSPTMIKSPSIEYSKKIWWDCLLSRYGQSRPEAYAAIIKEILTLFRISTHWIAFFNVPRFLAILHNPEQRQCLQPSLVYAMLALATQLTSWDGPGGRELDGRLLGLKLNDHAHNSFWQSWNSGFINVDLAKAAFLMSLYEVSSHPLYTRTRASQSLVLLDAVIRVLNLTAMDADNPRASRFQPDEIPRIPADARRVSPADYDELCLHAEQSIVNCSFWAACPRWSKPGSTYVDHVEIEKEEARRLCWSSSALAASASTYGHNVWKTYNNLSIANTANYALLFPGELLTEEADRIGKSSIWALYHTSSLIWHFSIRLHNDSSVSPKEKQKIFAKIWEATEETESYFGAVISDNLVYEGQTWHAKVGSLAYVWQSIDWLATSRFLIYDALVETMNASEHIPNYPVDAARRWLRVQASVAKMVCPGRAFSTDLTQRSVTMVEHRPFWIWWLIQQLARMISMYERDPSLVDILDIARGSFTPILDYLVNLYPSKVLAQTLSSRIFSRLNSLNERASHSYAVAFPASTAFGPRFPQLSSPLSDVSSCGGIEQSTTALPLLDEDVKP